MRARTFVVTAAVGLAALATSGCLTLLGGEERAGAQAARQVEVETGLVDDPERLAWVRAIGERLAANASRRDVTWRFQIVDMPEPNAFALPGGYVYVSRGLLALVNEEDELAGVIGHEIGHVTAGHANKRVTLGAPFAILTGITGWATGIVSPRLGDAVAGAGDTLTQGLVIAPFSRSQEREADRIGAELAARAGWDPRALGRLLETLDRFDQLAAGEERGSSWLDSHPPSPERAADLRRICEKLEQAPPHPIARDRAEVFQRLDGLVLGIDPASGVLVGERFVQPELGWSIRLPPGWEVGNTPTAVAAREPEGRAVVVLQPTPPDRDLDALVAEIGSGEGGLQIERVRVNGLPAARTHFQQEGYAVDVTWVEHRGRVYQISGVTPRAQHATWQDAFRQAAESFRDLRAEELAKVRDRRLRIATARSGETLEALLHRVGSPWSAELTAVANELTADATLAAGRPVKLARDEPYRPRGSGPETSD